MTIFGWQRKTFPAFLVVWTGGNGFLVLIYWFSGALVSLMWSFCFEILFCQGGKCLNFSHMLKMFSHILEDGKIARDFLSPTIWLSAVIRRFSFTQSSERIFKMIRNSTNFWHLLVAFKSNNFLSRLIIFSFPSDWADNNFLNLSISLSPRWNA